MAMNLNEKANVFGIPVNDFYVLLGIEIFIFLIGMLIMQYNFLGGGIFILFFGGLTFVAINVKKFLPDHFVTNLYRYFTSTRIYKTKTELNPDNALFKAIIDDKK